MAITIAVSNQKGGVGKTTTCVNLAAALAERGDAVLLIDLDPRGDLSHYCLADTSSRASSYELLTKTEDFDEEWVIRFLPAKLDLIPARLDLAAAEFVLSQEPERRSSFVSQPLTRFADEYDFIILDTAPGLQLLGLAALAAANLVIVPQQCSFLALQGLRAINDILTRLHTQAGVSVRLSGIVVTMYDRRTVHHRQVLEMVQQAFPHLVFKTPIPHTIRLQEAAVAHQPITAYEPTHPAAEAYRHLAREVIKRAKETSVTDRG
jgi:chromosome partitioning protein